MGSSPRSTDRGGESGRLYRESWQMLGELTPKLGRIRGEFMVINFNIKVSPNSALCCFHIGMCQKGSPQDAEKRGTRVTNQVRDEKRIHCI